MGPSSVVVTLYYKVAVIILFGVAELDVPPLQGRNLSLAETCPDRGENERIVRQAERVSGGLNSRSTSLGLSDVASRVAFSDFTNRPSPCAGLCSINSSSAAAFSKVRSVVTARRIVFFGKAPFPKVGDEPLDVFTFDFVESGVTESGQDVEP